MTENPDQAILSLLPVFILFFFFTYFIVIRPQRKRHQKHVDLINSMRVGDEIMFAGGIMATIHEINEETLSVSISKDVTIQINRFSVTHVLKRQPEQLGDRS